MRVSLILDSNFFPCPFRLRLMIVVCADFAPKIQIQARPVIVATRSAMFGQSYFTTWSI